MKRTFDLIVSVLALLLLFPVIGMVAMLVRLKLGSPVIFKQERPGLYGKSFYLYKFRTMNEDRDNNGSFLPDNTRLTQMGKFLRKYSLDELPQFINIVKGELSLVGPRPLLMEYLPLYNEVQGKRHLVKPGMTGWAQVNGRNTAGWEDRFEKDIWYVEHHHFLLDLKIILLTISKVVRSDGVNHSGHATMPIFKGSSVKNEGQ